LKLAILSVRHVVPLAALALLFCALPAQAMARVEIGVPVEEARLDSISGGKQPLLGKAELHVLLFFRPAHDRSRDILRQVAACEKTLESKSVRLVTIVSSSSPIDEVERMVKETGLTVPVLLDVGDELYAKLEIRQHPIAVLIGKDKKVVAFQPYTRLRYCDLLMAHIQLLLKEISPEEHAKVLDPGKAPMPNDDIRAVATRHVNLGERYLLKGNCALALLQFEEALAMDPANAKAADGKRKCEATGAK
jgi:hypothetical protein